MSNEAVAWIASHIGGAEVFMDDLRAVSRDALMTGGLSLSREDHDLIEDLAAAAMPMGMTPIEAKVQALLMISPDPLALDQIVALLRVSKSSVSVATRTLERHGAAQRFSEPGSKRIRYGASERSTGFFAAQVDYLGAIGNLILDRAKTRPDQAASSRLHVMGSFYLRIRDALEEVLKS